jgi:chromosome segregation ATPase
LWGRFVIIDTPNGRILKTLIDVGSSIGVSARALGTSYETPEGYEMMNEEDYTFFTFDAVPDPGFKIARPSPVFESNSKKELKEVVSGYTPAEMEISRVLMESINPDFFAEELQVINESLKKNSSKELLENSQRRINSLEKALEREKERQTVQASLGESRLPKSVMDRVRLMQESLSQSEAEIGLLKRKVVSLNESLERERRESKRLKSQIQSLKAAPVSESKDLTKLKGTIAQYEAREKKLKASIKEDRIKALSLVTGMSETKVASMVSNLDEPLEDIAVRLKRLMSKDANQPVLEARQKGAGEAQESDRTVRLIKSQQNKKKE